MKGRCSFRFVDGIPELPFAWRSNVGEAKRRLCSILTGAVGDNISQAFTKSLDIVFVRLPSVVVIKKSINILN